MPATAPSLDRAERVAREAAAFLKSPNWQQLGVIAHDLSQFGVLSLDECLAAFHAEDVDRLLDLVGLALIQLGRRFDPHAVH